MKQYIVDAFTETVFHGNQAAVCLLEEELSEETMLNVTKENGLPETAFAVKAQEGYDLRWFTPGGEIDLCGHATLATAFVLFGQREKDARRIVFHTRSGDLYVSREGEGLVMDFPAYHPKEVPVTREMTEAVGIPPVKAYLDRDLLLVYEDEKDVRRMTPDFEKVKALPGHGVGVTAPGKKYDCVSRFFAPKTKVNEDPVTGSVHCMIAPYWAGRLGRDRVSAYQASERGGAMVCELQGDRVKITGKAVLYAVCEINV